MNIALTSKLSITAGGIACRMLQKGARGNVIGVFSQGIYAKMGEEILLFHEAKWGCVPFGIAITDVHAFSETAKPSVEDEVLLSDTCIQIGKAAFAYELCGHPTVPATCRASLTEAHLSATYDYIRTHGSDGGMLALLAENRGNVREKIDALTRGNAEAAVKLIGLGRGLTPSGDDFLCGFFKLLEAAKETRFDAVREEVLRHLDRTTSISAAYVKSALSGEYFTVYDRAVRAILGDEPFEPNCDFVLAMGASSGTDTMLGMLAAAKLL